MSKALLPHVISLAEAKEQVWRNGGGTTRELLTRHQPGIDDWQYRISVAEVNSDGPFSHFERTQRHFCVLSGHGVDLTIDGMPHRVTKTSNALNFSGEAVVDCKLIDGPTSDLNFMIRSSSEPKPLSRMAPLSSAMSWDLSATSSAGIYTLQEGLCHWQFEGQHFDLSVESNHLVWFDTSPEHLIFKVSQAVVSIENPPRANIAWGMFVGRAEMNK
jgi:uncharacterized protein